MNKQKLIRIRNEVLILIFLVIAIIGGFRTYDDCKRNDEILSNKEKQLKAQVDFIYSLEFDKIQQTIYSSGNILLDQLEIKKCIKNKDRESLYKILLPHYNTLTTNFNSNIIMHFHLPNHDTLLRLHNKNIYNDNLHDKRPLVTKSIINKTSYAGFEHGLYDFEKLTYRVTFPIFENDLFLGILEIGIDTSYIEKIVKKQIKETNKADVFLVHLIKKGTNNFSSFGDYKGKVGNYIYSKDSQIDSIINKIEKEMVTKDRLLFKNNIIHVNNKTYIVSNQNIKLIDADQKQIGDYIFIFDATNDLKANQIFFYSSLAKPIVAGIIILLLITWIFKYFFKQFLIMEKRARKILDTQSSLIILTNGNELLDCNGALLQFYGFETLDAFKELHSCICDTFEPFDGFLQKYTDGELWIYRVLNQPNKIWKVAIKDKDKIKHIFTINLNSYNTDNNEEDSYFVITLVNISEMEKANKLLIEQSKQASMGEMIGNIAHQWRQPLSTISVLASSIQFKYENDMLDKDELIKIADKITQNTKHLSETIDTFRNYIRDDKEKVNLVLQDIIDSALNIILLALTDHKITLINKINYNEKVLVNLVKGELSQVIINIINNAKDALIASKQEHPEIEISLEIKNHIATIMIEDNGGGIANDIMPKIFEPYFTTKHKSQGTGLGLHMSYKIITESLNGKIYAVNTDKGARFLLEIPIEN